MEDNVDEVATLVIVFEVLYITLDTVDVVPSYDELNAIKVESYIGDDIVSAFVAKLPDGGAQ